MSNTITGLVPTIYNALDTVSRELVGMIPAVSMDPDYTRAAKDQTVTSPVAPASEASDLTPGVTPPDDGDQNIGNISMTINKVRRVPVRWNGEQSRALANGGPNRGRLIQQQFEQGFRVLANEIEADLCALYNTVSRAHGAAGTVPFDTVGDFTDASNILKILKDNGAPTGDASLILDTTAGANLLGKQSRYDVAGDTIMQNQGVIINKAGLAIRESGQIKTPAVGTADSATTDNAGYSEGDVTITLAAIGTGTILAGDVVTFAGDPNKYVVKTGNADVSTGGTIVLAAPGLRQDIAASATAITVIAETTRNMAFSRSAIYLATRAPALPEEGDSADDRMLVTDPRSGLTFEISLYKMYRQIQYEIAIAWGVKNTKTEHSATLLG